MEKKMRMKRPGTRSPFIKRLPLVASLAASLCLVPPSFSAAAVKRPVAARTLRLPALLSDLGSQDRDKALSAGRRLARMGEMAVMPLLGLVQRCGEKELSRRSLAVLSHIDWAKVGKGKRELTADSVSPLLKTFGGKGRAAESLLAEMVILSIGNDAMPIFRNMLESADRLDRMLAITALLQVDWKRIDHTNALAIKQSLGTLVQDEASRDVAKELMRRIGKVFVMCREVPARPEGVV